MNDILARFLVITNSEVDSYWMFCHYMDLKKSDFLENTMMEKIGEFIVERERGKGGSEGEFNCFLCVCTCTLSM